MTVTTEMNATRSLQRNFDDDASGTNAGLCDECAVVLRHISAVLIDALTRHCAREAVGQKSTDFEHHRSKGLPSIRRVVTSHSFSLDHRRCDPHVFGSKGHAQDDPRSDGWYLVRSSFPIFTLVSLFQD